ncbi:hypothetical protein J5X84_35980 [Streptosporangiaceae bacterium NEAU-GS5]|nr:hypothetical protein [Streptosporangiaceae bacterium NEAU-GS5]
MYTTSLPPSPDSPGVAAAWARGIAAAERPARADEAEQVARALVDQAVQRTPAGAQIHATITVTGDGLMIEVRDPSGVQTSDGAAWAVVSGVTSSYGTSGGPEGHTAWAELRAAS